MVVAETPSFDRIGTGVRFEDLIRRLGEDIYFLDDENEKHYCKMSIDDGKNKSSNMVKDNFEFVGDIDFFDEEKREFCQGDYFYRTLFPLRKYLLVSSTPNAFSDTMASVRIAQVNETVSIVYEEKRENEETGNIDIYIHYINKDIDVYSQTTPVAQKETDVGSISSLIYDVLVPAFYDVSTTHKILKKEKVLNVETLKSEYQEVLYDIESVDDSLSFSIDNVNFYGTNILAIKKNTDGIQPDTIFVNNIGD